MRFDKWILGLSISVALVFSVAQSVAADSALDSIDSEIRSEAHRMEKSVAIQRKKPTSKTKSKLKSKAYTAPSEKPYLVAQNSKKPVRTSQRATLTQKVKPKSQVKTEPNFDSYFDDNSSKSNVQTNIQTQVSVPVKKVAPPISSAFNGKVSFSLGSDNNVTADKDADGYDGTFYQIAPSLGFNVGGFNGSFGASIKDFMDQEVSNVAKTTEGTAQLGYTGDLSTWATSKTKLSGLYHDERWPDYIRGKSFNSNNNEFYYEGMPIKYNEAKIDQALAFNFGTLTLEIGAYGLQRDYKSLYSDFADDLFEEYLYEKDYNEISGYGRIGLAANDYIEVATRPSVVQQKYEQRRARLPDGSWGGLLLNDSTPLYQLTTSEVAFDLTFKYKQSSITPTALIGQTSDDGLGAEDRSHYGFGIAGNLVLDEGSKLTISPSYNFKKLNYDNWTHRIEPAGTGAKRVDTEFTLAVKASMMLANNFGIAASYEKFNEESNKAADTSENFDQEVITSSLIFTF